MNSCDNIVQLLSISKAYPGVQALSEVCFDLRPGEVHALIGENGAGKSTLIKILMGIVQRDSGSILLNNEPVEINSAQEARELEIAAVFQELSLIPTLTVAENIFIKREQKVGAIFLNRREIFMKAKNLLSEYEIDVDPHAMVSNLSIAKRQLVEILKATAYKPKVLILDEPTSALTAGEAEILFALIRTLKDEGTGIIYISHRMAEIFRIADRVTILRDGRQVGEFHTSKLDMQTIVKHMVGREIELYEFKRRTEKKNKSQPILTVENLNQGEIFKNISFKVYPGEILGIAGLVGSGRSELMQALFGITKMDSGTITINNQTVEINSVGDALNAGLGMIPESRHIQGLILMHSIADNISLLSLDKFLRNRFLQHRKIKKFTDKKITEFDIKTDSRNKLVRYLSGGNQQKVVIAKWLSKNPKILITDELTAGIDIHSKSEIQKLIRSLADDGVGVIMISSEMPELLANSDRILVMNQNRIIGEMVDPTQEEIMSLIMTDNNS